MCVAPRAHLLSSRRVSIISSRLAMPMSSNIRRTRTWRRWWAAHNETRRGVGRWSKCGCCSSALPKLHTRFDFAAARWRWEGEGTSPRSMAVDATERTRCMLGLLGQEVRPEMEVSQEVVRSPTGGWCSLSASRSRPRASEQPASSGSTVVASGSRGASASKSVASTVSSSNAAGGASPQRCAAHTVPSSGATSAACTSSVGPCESPASSAARARISCSTPA
mmetsp:Transcript_58523/g.164091  ORF Transcript_58523/g.164091 Transcript_58523/m.164091 type:complete len:222 (+) Transcript_58523:383-1048(+)